MSSNKQFLSLPDEFDASRYYYERGEKPDTCFVNITDIVMAGFSPGTQFNDHTTLIKSDGSHISLFYQAAQDSRGTSPNGHKHHLDLMTLIKNRTGQILVETSRDERYGSLTITNVNPAHAIGLQHWNDRLSLFVKGLSSDSTVEDKTVHQTLMTDVTDALTDALTLKFKIRKEECSLVVSKSAVNAVWQNFGAVLMWLDGMKAPTQIGYFDHDDQEAAGKILDEIVDASPGALRGARLGEGMGGPAAFFTRPEYVDSISASDNSLQIEFADAARLKTESYRAPSFYIKGDAQAAAKKLMLALNS
jgi:hypothetical protein